ncbi:putative ABC transporter transmembrane protein [Actinokineospora spheciospongiae]|uniref:Transport permease protein n=1 Tax=Actinokineospora spheciospongiae TaxID=909613 RepID=W7IPI1_9PSEU|nr:ABC transporter permease [Actinokineospora spheciospongiae]EWC58627.1 putative ABC transporter transmembrane protein [Actinokineospora spheciospongiae]
MPRDTWLVFERGLTLSLRNPAWIAIGLVQPVLYLFFFGPLLESITATTPGFPAGTAWQILTPALIVQVALFSGSYVGFALLAELRLGVVERLRVTPVSRFALLLGKVLRDALQTVVQSLLIIAMAYLLFDLRASVGAVLLTLVIVAMVSLTLSSCSYALALRLKNEEAFPAILNTVLMPVLLLSGIVVPITRGLAPDWLYAISRWNPFTHVVDAERASFRGDFTVDGLLTGSLVLFAMTVLALIWGGRTFARENA